MNLRIKRFVHLAVALSTVPMASLAQNAATDDGMLEEIVVTAQKREQSLRDVPLSVEAVSGKKLADAGIVRLDALMAYVPNLQVTETGIANNVYIRGIGSGLNQGFEQSVSTYSDGIYRGRGPQSRMPFLDLARVEVLRGPQPILFGKNAVAGAVNLVSALPTREAERQVRISHDFELNDTIANFVASGPLSDSFGARIAIHKRNADGYVHNLTINGRGEPQRDELGARLTLTGELSDALSMVFRFEGGSYNTVGRQIEIFGETPTVAGAPIPGVTYSQIVGGPPPALPQGQHVSARNNVLDYQRSSNGDTSDFSNREISLTLNYRLPSDVTLTSVTGYSMYRQNELCDCDFVGATVFRAAIGEEYNQYSQEIRFTSSTEGSFSWIGGLFYQRYDLDESDFLHVPSTSLIMPVLTGFFVREFLSGRSSPCTSAATCAAQAAGAAGLFSNAANPRVFTQNSKQYSAFAQGTLKLNDTFSVTAGGRVSKESKDGSRVTRLTAGVGGPNLPAAVTPLFGQVLGIVPHSVAGKRKETNFSPLINLQYQLTPETMSYLSWSRGFKSGGFDARSNKPVASGGSFEYADERATTYEMGVKSGLGSHAELNANVFYTDYKDLQTTAFDGAIGFNVGNGSARVKGAELEGRWRPTRQLTLSGSVAYLDFEWTKYLGQCYFDKLLAAPTVANCDYKGRSNQLAPKFTGNMSAEYSWSLGDSLKLTTTADLVHSSRFLQSLNLDPVAAQESFSKINARIALSDQDGKWELALVGRNLTDKTTVSYAGDTPLAFRLFRARSYYGFVDPPRGIALEARLRF